MSLALSGDIQVSCSSLSYQISRWARVVLCPTPCKQDCTGQAPWLPRAHPSQAHSVPARSGPRVFQKLCPWFCSSHISGACEGLAFVKTQAPVHRSEALSHLAVGLVSLAYGCLLLLAIWFFSSDSLFPGSQTKDSIDPHPLLP